MSIVIEQSAEDAKLCLALVRRAELDHLRLIDARIQCGDRGDEDLGSVEFQLKFKPLSAKFENERMHVKIAFAFRIVGPVEGMRDLVKISCSFEATYRIESTYTPSAAQIQAFKNANAVFNCWPFFREFVQNTVTRMDFPPPPIPFLKLQPRPVSATTSLPQEDAPKDDAAVIRSQAAKRRNS